MTDKDSGPESGGKGVVEDIKGKVKEAAGAVSGKEDLRREGQAQQEKADAQRDVAAKEAEAEKARAEARAREVEQKRDTRSVDNDRETVIAAATDAGYWLLQPGVAASGCGVSSRVTIRARRSSLAGGRRSTTWPTV